MSAPTGSPSLYWVKGGSSGTDTVSVPSVRVSNSEAGVQSSATSVSPPELSHPVSTSAATPTAPAHVMSFFIGLSSSLRIEMCTVSHLIDNLRLRFGRSTRRRGCGDEQSGPTRSAEDAAAVDIRPGEALHAGRRVSVRADPVREFTRGGAGDLELPGARGPHGPHVLGARRGGAEPRLPGAADDRAGSARGAGDAADRRGLDDGEARGTRRLRRRARDRGRTGARVRHTSARGARARSSRRRPPVPHVPDRPAGQLPHLADGGDRKSVV